MLAVCTVNTSGKMAAFEYLRIVSVKGAGVTWRSRAARRRPSSCCGVWHDRDRQTRCLRQPSRHDYPSCIVYRTPADGKPPPPRATGAVRRDVTNLQSEWRQTHVCGLWLAVERRSTTAQTIDKAPGAKAMHHAEPLTKLRVAGKADDRRPVSWRAAGDGHHPKRRICWTDEHPPRTNALSPGRVDLWVPMPRLRVPAAVFLASGLPDFGPVSTGAFCRRPASGLSGPCPAAPASPRGPASTSSPACGGIAGRSRRAARSSTSEPQAASGPAHFEDGFSGWCLPRLVEPRLFAFVQEQEQQRRRPVSSSLATTGPAHTDAGSFLGWCGGRAGQLPCPRAAHRRSTPGTACISRRPGREIVETARLQWPRRSQVGIGWERGQAYSSGVAAALLFAVARVYGKRLTRWSSDLCRFHFRRGTPYRLHSDRSFTARPYRFGASIQTSATSVTVRCVWPAAAAYDCLAGDLTSAVHAEQVAARAERFRGFRRVEHGAPPDWSETRWRI